MTFCIQFKEYPWFIATQMITCKIARNDCYEALLTCKMFPETSPSWPDSIKLFFWQCYCIIHGVAAVEQTTTTATDVQTALEDFVEIIFNNSEAVPKDSVGMEFLIESLGICLESATSQRCYWVLDKITTKLYHLKQPQKYQVHYSGHNTMFQSTWICLKMMEACLHRREDGAQICLQLKECNNLLFYILIPIAAEERRYPILAKISTNCVTSVLIHSMTTKMDHDDSSFPVRQQMDEVRALIKLLCSHLISTVEQTIDLLYHVIQKSSKQEIATILAHSTKDLHELIEALVQAESCHQLSVETSDKLVYSFMMLIRHVTDYHFLARGAGQRPLMLLVQIVGGTSFGGNQIIENQQRNNHRVIAVCILMQLSKNPCNRRILAKTPGLLSSMIRHVRNYTHHEQQQHDHDDDSDDTTATTTCRLTREEMKQQIFQLAESL